jgi:hypothetical protein
VAAGCVLAATVVSGCNHSATFAIVACQMGGGEVTTGRYGGLVCRHIGDQPVRRLERRGAPPAAERFRASIRTRAGRRPKIRRRGDTARANGMRHRGTLRIRPGRRTKRALRGFARGRFASRVNMRAGGRDGLGTINGFMAVGFGRRGASCLRVQAQVTDLDGPPLAQIYFRTVGGTGRAARLRVTGQAPYDSSARTVSGTLVAKRSGPRRPPRACRPLLARVKKRA